MCGISAYCGKQPAELFLLKALQRLEYRGYDGFGYLLSDGDHWLIRRELVPPSQVYAIEAPNSCTIGIGHTRWATHGKPSLKNTHPILGGKDNTTAIVHNGTLENYDNIKQCLSNQGYVFVTDTDTEVIAHFLDYLFTIYQCQTYIDDHLSHIVNTALNNLQGNLALAMITKYARNRIVVAARGMSMVVSPDGYAASDPAAFEDFTDKYYQLESHEIAVGGAFQDFDDGFKIFNMHENRYTIPLWTDLSKNTCLIEEINHPHKMYQEILSQSDLVKVNGDYNHIPEIPQTPDKVFLFGCGSSYNAALLGKYYIEQIAGLPAEVEYASELLYRPMLQPKNTLFIGITQSGETADTLRAMELIQNQQKVICITNNTESQAYRNFPCILLNAGQEIGVAATKTFTLECLLLLNLAIKLAEIQGMHTISTDLKWLSTYIDEIFRQQSKLIEISDYISKYNSALYLARSYNYPIALEGALKLKEVSYIHAEAMPAAEMKHGPIALIDDKTVSIFIITNQKDSLQNKVLTNMQEIKTRGGKILAITDTLTTSSVWNIADWYFCIPKCSEYLQPIVANIVLQLIAYYVAVALERNVDKPRNLSKTVTVE